MNPLRTPQKLRVVECECPASRSYAWRAESMTVPSYAYCMAVIRTPVRLGSTWSKNSRSSHHISYPFVHYGKTLSSYRCHTMRCDMRRMKSPHTAERTPNVTNQTIYHPCLRVFFFPFFDFVDHDCTSQAILPFSDWMNNNKM
jgi:hypothetical protein